MANRKVHVKMNMNELDYLEQYTLGLKVYGMMILLTTLFPNPTGGMLILQTTSNALKTAFENYEGNPKLMSALKIAVDNWLAAINPIALYVDSVANGNAATIDASGFEKTSDTNAPASKPGVPVIKLTKSEIDGGLDVEILTQKDANGFGALLYTPDLTPVIAGGQITFTIVQPTVTSQISFIFNQQKKMSFIGLISKKTMRLIVWAINAWGAGNPSSPTDKGIQ